MIGRREIIRRIQEEGLVENLVSRKQIQQAGVDLTVGKVYRLSGQGALDFDNSKRELCQYQDIPSDEESWELEPDTYHFAMNERINIPLDLCGLLLPRSSALACGMEVHTALWDPGYQGRSFMHVVVTRRTRIYENARIGQMVFLPVTGGQSAYSGLYLGEDVLERGRRGKQAKLED